MDALAYLVVIEFTQSTCFTELRVLKKKKNTRSYTRSEYLLRLLAENIILEVSFITFVKNSIHSGYLKSGTDLYFISIICIIVYNIYV